jgi:hypothetical protein
VFATLRPYLRLEGPGLINFSSTIFSLPSPGPVGIRHVRDGPLEHSKPLYYYYYYY